MDHRLEIHELVDRLSEADLENASARLKEILDIAEVLEDPAFLVMRDENRRHMEEFAERSREAGEDFVGGVMGSTSVMSGPDGPRRSAHMTSSHAKDGVYITRTIRTFENQDIETIEKYRLDKESDSIVISWDVASAGWTDSRTLSIPYHPSDR